MKTKWIPVLMMAAVSGPGWVTAPCQTQGRFPLTAHQVAQALSQSGIQTTGEQVSLLATVVASEPAPVLDILSIEAIGGRVSSNHRQSGSLVKLGCREPGVCLPFYSMVGKLEAPGNTAPAALRVTSEAGSAARRPDTAIVIRVGAHATLMMDDARAHVEMTVVSLENGAAGHKIHVATPNHKQVYLAEVVSANLLKRSF
jgi:hypothetical protein